jgi:hypothetical protein
LRKKAFTSLDTLKVPNDREAVINQCPQVAHGPGHLGP